MKIPVLNAEILSSSELNRLNSNVKKLSDEVLVLKNTPLPFLDGLWGAGQTTEGHLLLPIPPVMLYEAGRNSNEVGIIFSGLKREIFRNGYDFFERWNSKCRQCDKEFEFETDECDSCGFETVVPNFAEVKRLKEFLKTLTRGKEKAQSFLELCDQLEEDLETVDEIFLVLVKNYFYNDAGEIVGAEVKRLVRGSPINFQLITDRHGRLGFDKEGRKVMVCPVHRDTVFFGSKQVICNRCNCRLYNAHYKEVSVVGTGKQSASELYYIEGEVIHESKYYPSLDRGYSPLISVWNKVEALRAMDLYVKEYYSKQRPPKGLLMVNTVNREELEKAWEHIKKETQGNPHLVHLMGVQSNSTRGNVAQFIDFMNNLTESQYVEVRREFTVKIGARFGVMPLFQGDLSTSGGLNSVLGDTPIIVRKQKKWVDIFPIASLHTDYDHVRSFYSLEKYEALSKDGWTQIKYSFRKKSKKKIYDIITNDGFTQVTEDHSLFMGGKEVKGSEISVGDKLDLVKPEPVVYENSPISKDLAWALGFFSAEGYADRMKRNKSNGELQGVRVTISQVNREPLEKCKFVFDSFFGINSKLRLETNSNGNNIFYLDLSHNKVFEWLDEYCYSEYVEKKTKNNKTETIIYREKKVPIQVLNGNREIMQSFIDGYWKGDGHTDRNGRKRCSGVYKSLMAGLKYLFGCLGKTTSVSWKPNGKNNIVLLGVLKSEERQRGRLENEVKEIKEYDYYGDLYDIETENHSFVAGIGSILHHNSEGLQITVTNRAITTGQSFWNDNVFPQLMKQFGVEDFELKLNPNEEQDEVAEVDLKIKKAQHAQLMMSMGYDSELLDDGENFKFSGEPTKPANLEGLGGSGLGAPGFDEQNFEGQPEDVGMSKAKMPSFISRDLKKKLEREFSDIFKRFKFKRKPSEAKLKEITKELSQKIKKELQNSLGKNIKGIYKTSLEGVEKELGVKIGFGKIDKNALEVIAKGRIFQGVFKNVSESVKKNLFETISKAYEKPLSTPKLIDKLSETIEGERYQLERIARTETHHISAIARSNSYFKADPNGKFKYKWIGPMDSRTTEVCKEITRKTEAGVSKSLLKKIVQDVAKKHGFKARDFTPHFSCRHIFIRKIEKTGGVK